MNKKTTKDNKQIKPRKLTRKQQAFVNTLLNNPKMSATQAVLQTYNTTDYSTAGSIAVENLQKPAIQSQLQNYSELVENTLITDVIQFKDSKDLKERQLANDTSRYIHDKIHGKSKQITEVTTQGISLNIDLTTAIQTEIEEEKT